MCMNWPRQMFGQTLTEKLNQGIESACEGPTGSSTEDQWVKLKTAITAGAETCQGKSSSRPARSLGSQRNWSERWMREGHGRTSTLKIKEGSIINWIINRKEKPTMLGESWLSNAVHERMRRVIYGRSEHSGLAMTCIGTCIVACKTQSRMAFEIQRNHIMAIASRWLFQIGGSGRCWISYWDVRQDRSITELHLPTNWTHSSQIHVPPIQTWPTLLIYCRIQYWKIHPPAC